MIEAHDKADECERDLQPIDIVSAFADTTTVEWRKSEANREHIETIRLQSKALIGAYKTVVEAQAIFDGVTWISR